MKRSGGTLEHRLSERVGGFNLRLEFSHPIFPTVILGQESLLVPPLAVCRKNLQDMLAHVMAELVGLGYVLALWGPAIPESLELLELVVIGAFTHVRRSADLPPIYDADGAVNRFVKVNFGS